MRVVEQCFDEGESFGALVRCTFPDEGFASFEQWVEAMGSDDSDESVSNLWLGGGQWLLHGMALVYGLQISVASYYADGAGGFRKGPPRLVVDGGGRSITLCMLHDDEGVADHFDVLEREESAPSLPPSPPPSVGSFDDESCGDVKRQAEPRLNKTSASSCAPSLAALMAAASLEDEHEGQLTVVSL